MARPEQNRIRPAKTPPMVAALAWLLAAAGAAVLYAGSIHFGRWEAANAPPLPVPLVGHTRPSPGQVDVLPNTSISADVYLPNVGSGVSSATMNTRTVHLDKLLPGGRSVPVEGNVNTSGAGDSIVFVPSDMLDGGSTYRFSCYGVKDMSGALFKPYSMTFTTASNAKLSQYPVAFEHVQMPETFGHIFTGLTIGPDHRLYAGSYEGTIYRYDIGQGGVLVEPPALIQTVRRNNVTPDNAFGDRLITGICFDPRSTVENPILWITNGQCRVEHCDDWSCKLSRLSGPNLTVYQDAIVGLPRAYRDHLSFKIAFDPKDPSHLYFNQGSSSSTGAADRTWGLYPEHLLTAACLQVDVPAIEQVMSGGRPLNVKTEDDGHYDPWLPGAPLKLYATGIRSGFSLLFHSNGHLYSCVNGGAEGGAAPGTPDSLADVPRRIDQAKFGPYLGPVVPGIECVAETQPDLFIAYYGHPNETRGEYVLFGGNPDGGSDNYQVHNAANGTGGYPVGVQPDRNWHPAIWNLGISYSCNGLIEYHGKAFGGYLDGKILTTRFSSGKDIAILELTRDGKVAAQVTGVDGLTRFVDPLDLVEDTASGDVYVSEWGGHKLTLLRPMATKSGRVFNSSTGPPTGR
jgi:hypothetical protein